jgi:hypothetical protein
MVEMANTIVPKPTKVRVTPAEMNQCSPDSHKRQDALRIIIKQRAEE